MHWATLGLFVDFLIRLVAGPGPSPLAQLARIPGVRLKPQLAYGELNTANNGIIAVSNCLQSII